MTKKEIALTDEQGHYLRHVMRLQSGNTVTLFNGGGGEYHAVIEHLGHEETICRVETFIPADRETACKVHIIQAACRNEKIESILQKGTELGASSFQIVRTERSTLKLKESKLRNRFKRWQKIIVEAAEQSGRTRLPALCWRQTLKNIHMSGLSYVLHPLAAHPWAQERQRMVQANEIDFLIGPEGGFSKRDMNTLTGMGCAPLAFGQRIMRTETAAPALLAAMQAIQLDAN